MKFKILRFLFFFCILYFIGLSTHLSQFAMLPNSFWLPNGLMQIFSSPPLHWKIVRWLQWTWGILLFLSSLGLGGRAIYIFTALVGSFLIGQAQSYGYFTHTYMPIVLSLWIWVLFPKQPFRLIQLIFALTFFGAGISKMVNGENWFSGESLYNYLAQSDLQYYDVHSFAHKFKLNIQLLKFPESFKYIASSVILLELSCLFAWFNNKAAKIIIPVMLLLQIGIYFTIYVNFQMYLALYLAWLDSNPKVSENS